MQVNPLQLLTESMWPEGIHIGLIGRMNNHNKKIMYRSTLSCLAAVLLPFSAGVAADEQPTDREILQIQTIASCIDDVYYQGGYEDGDTARIDLIDTMLVLFDLPAYDEEYLYLDVPYDGKLSSELYYQCISGQRDMLDEAADSLGIAAH